MGASWILYSLHQRLLAFLLLDILVGAVIVADRSPQAIIFRRLFVLLIKIIANDKSNTMPDQNCLDGSGMVSVTTSLDDDDDDDITNHTSVHH